MNVLGRTFLTVFVATCVACGAPASHVPRTPGTALATAFAGAFRTDAVGASDKAIAAYLRLIRDAAQDDVNPWQVAAIEASLDALVNRSMPAFGTASRDVALIYRTGLADSVTGDLARTAAQAKGPFARGLIARALLTAAQRRGDAVSAARLRQASGCATRALVVGPLSWEPITGPEQPSPLDPSEVPIAASYATDSPFGTRATPAIVSGYGCALPSFIESARPGVRDMVVDVVVPTAQTVGIAFRSRAPAVLRANGTALVERSFALADRDAVRFVRVLASAGTLRLVARVGATDNESIEIDAFSEEGTPLKTQAPTVGSTANARVVSHSSYDLPSPATEDETLLAAAAELADGDARSAENSLVFANRRGRPDLDILYGRATSDATDLPRAVRVERAFTAYERALDSWPTSWEALIAHAVLAGQRRGRDESGLTALEDIEGRRPQPADAPMPPTSIVDAFIAMTSGQEKMFDRAQSALFRANGSLKGTALFVHAEDACLPRVGAALVRAECDPARMAGDTLACYDALDASGDVDAAEGELSRLRAIFGAPARFLPMELRDALAKGDKTAARRIFDAMLPAERTLSALACVSAEDRRSIDADVRRHSVTASDAPASLGPLLAWESQKDVARLDDEAARIAAQDRAEPVLPNAATAILAHTEHYEIGSEGFVHWRLFDVRRVSDTIDVDENAQASAPEFWGHSAMRILRRRILKANGRIVEPDPAPRASQSHADLSQLEKGDIVEAVYEGYGVPGDTGDVGIDSPDLLPARTAVKEASIELSVPARLSSGSALWAHSLLGKAIEEADGDRRTMRWQLADQSARRIEDGVPRMNRAVGISFSTQRWATMGRALGETLAALDERDPEIASWASAAAPGSKAPSLALLDAVVASAGAAIREGEMDTLSDYASISSSSQTQTARTFLATHQGSRTWLVYRALRELGVSSDVVVAENEPYSDDPSFPPHVGRFVHPLLVAHLPEGSPEGKKDVWIDADVAGPPLPPGHISPQLRGRLAMQIDGAIAPLPAVVDRERDEIDVRLKLGESGAASGTVAVLLRGAQAQDLAETLLRIVGAEREQALRDLVLAWLPWANVERVDLSSAEDAWQIELRADVTVSAYAQPEGEHVWILPGIDALHAARPRAHVASLASAFATRADRQSPLVLSNAVQYHLHRRVELPPGAHVARLPEPLEVRDEPIQASRRLNPMPNAIDEDFILEVSTGTVAASSYDAFASTVQSVDDGFLASERLSVGGL